MCLDYFTVIYLKLLMLVFCVNIHFMSMLFVQLTYCYKDQEKLPESLVSQKKKLPGFFLPRAGTHSRGV